MGCQPLGLGHHFFNHHKFKIMKIEIQSTEKIVHLNKVPARIWEGTTDSGIKVHCYVTRIAVDKDEPNQEQFQKELQEHKPPSAEVMAIPLYMII